jgi:thymidylate synthase ThyX
MKKRSSLPLNWQAIANLRKKSIRYAVKYISKDQRVIVVDGLNPEDNAMIQALYSRDPKSVLAHIEKLKKDGTKTVMGTYYVGYNHGSIGQCGFFTINLEGVSMLVAKAFQNSSLYNGQESSTRYLNMTLQATKNPANTEAGEQLQKRSMAFYEKVLADLIPHLKQRFPKPKCVETDEKLIKKFDSEYEKSIKAKAFDIARGFLPAGVTTYLSWTTSLQHAKQRIDILRNHHVQEVAEVAEQVFQAMKETYPDSFGHKEYPATNAYNALIASKLSYHDLPYQPFTVLKNAFDVDDLKSYSEIVKSRPEYSELPWEMNECGQMRVTFPIDFGSFRDIQRHRPWVLKMPLLTADHGFFPWYMNQLPTVLRNESKAYLREYEKDVKKMDVTPVELQNYILMGYTVQAETTGSFPQYVYVCELRTKQTVHPTLRIPEQQIATYLRNWFKKELGFTLPLYPDMTEDAFSLRRGKQDITLK